MEKINFRFQNDDGEKLEDDKEKFNAYLKNLISPHSGYDFLCDY